MNFYQNFINIVLKNNKIDFMSPIEIQSDHPLVVILQLSPGSYDLNQFILPKYVGKHQNLMAHAIKNIMEFHEDDPMYQYRTIALNPELFPQNLQQDLTVYINLELYDYKTIDADSSEFIFAIELIPIKLYTEYLQYLEKSLDKIIAYNNKLNESLSKNSICGEISRVLQCIKIAHNFNLANYKCDKEKLFSLPQAIQEMIDLFHQNQMSNLQICFEYDKSVDITFNEKKMASTVLLHSVCNVLHNAIKYAKSQIIITMKLNNDDVIEIAIFDDGNPCNANVFSPKKKKSIDLSQKNFWQDNWQLGLITTKKLLKKHAGNIALIEQENGKSFVISINKQILSNEPMNQYAEIFPVGNIINRQQRILLEYFLHSIKNLLILIPQNTQHNYIIDAIRTELQQIFKHYIYNQKSQSVSHNLNAYNFIVKQVEQKTLLEINIAILDDDVFILKNHENIILKNLDALQQFFDYDLKITLQTFQSSFKFLEVYEHDPKKINVLISDINMKEMNGLEVAKRISVQNSCIIILCSGDNISNIPSYIYKVIDKPLKIDTLMHLFKGMNNKLNDQPQSINLQKIEENIIAENIFDPPITESQSICDNWCVIY